MSKVRYTCNIFIKSRKKGQTRVCITGRGTYMDNKYSYPEPQNCNI